MPYNHAVEVALAALAGSSCYFSGCHAPVAVTVEGEVVSNVRPAPVRAKAFWGPRHDPAMTREQRDHWANVVLLCHPHHTWVASRHAERYTPEQLHAWKGERETGAMRGLAGLGEVTEERLQRIVRDAVGIRDAHLLAAVRRLDRAGEFELAAAVAEIRGSTATALDAADLPHDGMSTLAAPMVDVPEQTRR